MLFGTILIYIAHNTDGNFLINLVENVGGGPAIMGYLAAFTAIVEVPVMMFSDRLPKKWSRVQYIRLAFVFFVLKTLAYALAPNIPLLFASRMLQAPSYALYTVLIVGYADEVVARKDSAKAQSLAFSMTTIGSVLASLIGGSMFKTVGVRPTMLTATAFAAAGAVIAIWATYWKSGKK
jgi:PPP family 3-phenylpropionic acid transporter